MTPAEARELFSAAFERELDAAQQQAFDAALAADAQLAREYQAFTAMLELARGSGADTAPDEPVPDLLPGVQQRLRARSRGRFYADRFSERLGSGLLQPLPLALIMLGLLAHKRAWKHRREAAGLPADRPNVVFGAETHVVWDKFANYFDVEMRKIPMKPDRYVLRAEDLPDYVDENTIAVGAVLGTTHIGESDPIEEINDYLRDICRSEVSARDFRTWGGTVSVVEALGPVDPGGLSAGDRTRQFLSAVDLAAERLGNTRSVCRSSYVHPAVEPAFESGDLRASWQRARRTKRLTRAERATLRLLVDDAASR